jgi:hypothetical protein
MKKILFSTLIVGACTINSSHAQQHEAQVVALDVIKLSELKNIISQMKTAYDIIDGGLKVVKGISEGNFNIHKTFLDGLEEVNPEVAKYKRIADIIELELKIKDLTQDSYNHFKNDPSFSVEEIAYMSGVYGKVSKTAIKGLDELLIVITSGEAKMMDDERLKAIDRIYLDVLGAYHALSTFNKELSFISFQRTDEDNALDRFQKLYGLEE